LHRRIDLEDVVSAHLLAIEKAEALGFQKYIISATSPFTQAHLADLQVDAPSIVQNIYPEFEQIYAAKHWKMFPKIGRVYVNEKARIELGWQPKYDFQYVLDCLRKDQDFRSPITHQIGRKGYHKETFEDGPFPIEDN